MPNVIPNHVPSPRTMLAWDGTAYRPPLIDNTGRIQVRGKDQLISYLASLLSKTTGVVSGAGGYLESAAVPAGELWHVTHVACRDVTTATTKHLYTVVRGAIGHNFFEQTAAFGIGQRSYMLTDLWMEEGDVIRCVFTGSAALDQCDVGLLGHTMTKE